MVLSLVERWDTRKRPSQQFGRGAFLQMMAQSYSPSR